jgi:hypothetical protein
MVLAIGVTGYYYNGPGSARIPELISSMLLFPLQLMQTYSPGSFGAFIANNPSVIFIILWISYCVVAIWLTPLLLVRSHTEEDLRKWYNSRPGNR